MCCSERQCVYYVVVYTVLYACSGILRCVDRFLNYFDPAPPTSEEPPRNAELGMATVGVFFSFLLFFAAGLLARSNHQNKRSGITAWVNIFLFNFVWQLASTILDFYYGVVGYNYVYAGLSIGLLVVDLVCMLSMVQYREHVISGPVRLTAHIPVQNIILPPNPRPPANAVGPQRPVTVPSAPPPPRPPPPQTVQSPLQPPPQTQPATAPQQPSLEQPPALPQSPSPSLPPDQQQLQPYQPPAQQQPVQYQQQQAQPVQYQYYQQPQMMYQPQMVQPQAMVIMDPGYAQPTTWWGGMGRGFGWNRGFGGNYGGGGFGGNGFGFGGFGHGGMFDHHHHHDFGHGFGHHHHHSF